MRRTEGDACRHVIDNLGHDTGPVDGIDRDQACAVQKRLIGETGLDHGLCIVEIALDGDVVHVGRIDRGHLASLHLGHALVRMQDKDIQVVTRLAALDGRRAGITRGRAHDHALLAARTQEMIEQAAQEL